jgi:hypothetical protein
MAVKKEFVGLVSILACFEESELARSAEEAVNRFYRFYLGALSTKKIGPS